MTKKRFKNAVLLFIGLPLIMFVAILFGIVMHYRTDRYDIVHAAFLSVTNPLGQDKTAALWYSNGELKESVKSKGLLAQSGLDGFNLDKPDLMACAVSNYTVEKIVGRQDFGFILLKRSLTNGYSFTVFKGPKRFLQFHYPEINNSQR